MSNKEENNNVKNNDEVKAKDSNAPNSDVKIRKKKPLKQIKILSD